MLIVEPTVCGDDHGFFVTSDCAEVQYQTTEYWAPQREPCIVWNDRDIGVTWPLTGEPVLTQKDRPGLPLGETQVFP